MPATNHVMSALALPCEAITMEFCCRQHNRLLAHKDNKTLSLSSRGLQSNEKMCVPGNRFSIISVLTSIYKMQGQQHIPLKYGSGSQEIHIEEASLKLKIKG